MPLPRYSGGVRFLVLPPAGVGASSSVLPAFRFLVLPPAGYFPAMESNPPEAGPENKNHQSTEEEAEASHPPTPQTEGPRPGPLWTI